MKKLPISLILLASIALFFACRPAKETRITEIDQYEQMLKKEMTVISKEKAETLISLYSSYAQDFPADSLSSIYLCRAGIVASNIDDCQQAIQLFDQTVALSPSSASAEESSFRKGYVYEKTCKDIEKAREAYKHFILTFPNSNYLKDANTLLEMLDYPSDLDMIRLFESQDVAD